VSYFTLERFLAEQRRPAPARDRWFESVSLQRRVCELLWFLSGRALCRRRALFGGGVAGDFAGQWHGLRLPFRQPGQHVDARGVNARRQPADDGGVQQSGHVRPQVAQNSPQSIVPDLATGWSWNEEGTELTLPLRRGVKWHDGRPFTANDVRCTWDLLTGRGSDKLRINPRKSWYDNLDAVTTNGDFEVTFHLKRPQPLFLTLLASGWSPVYPCHVPARDMRQHPIGTGPLYGRGC
jgi:Bacterial extracellular solute-binding proteins, family 5 Middle